MVKFKKTWQSRVLACALAAALTAGTAVMTPIADFVGTNTIASAATYTDEVDAEYLQSGDTLKAGANLVCEDYYFQILDENNNEIVSKTDDWNVDKDYTIVSITFDSVEWLFTIHVTSATSAPKLAQGLIINSGDTADFTGQWFRIDDEEWSWGQGVYTITYVGYSDDGQYCFLLGDVPIIGDLQIYVTSPNIGANVALKVNGGNGTEDKPFTFEVVPASSTSTPKLAQGLIINSGDTVDFTGQWFRSDDYIYDEWSCGEGVVTITYFSYTDSYTTDVGQYCFLVGNKATYVTSPNIGTDVALKVNGGDGTKDKPFTFEVVPATSTPTSAPKLAQDLIIHSGDTVDFTGQWYMTDDIWGAFCGEGVYTITCGSYDFGRYSFLVGNTETYVTSLNIGTDVALKVNGGDGTESNPFTFEVVPASYTPAPKLAQGLIINSGDTVDFVNQWYMIDDNPKHGGWGWGQDVYTITYFYYAPDFDQYCFLLGDMQIYVTSPDIGTDVALKVKGGNGTENSPFTFEVITTCTATWLNEDGSLIAATPFGKGFAPIYKGVYPTKEGCDFVGWTSDGGTTVYENDKLPASSTNVTYTAVFKESIADYQFTWADDYSSATVVFNAEAPVDANVVRTPDYVNKEIVYTASADYKNRTYTETKTVPFPDLADVADVAVDDIVINQDMPTVTVTDTATNTVLELDKDYTVEYSGDTTNAGTATVTITAKDGSTYIGSKSVKFAVLPREMKASITNRRKIGNNAKVVLSSEWYLPKNATNIKAGIARLSTDDTNITKYDVYNNGVKKASALKTTSGKYSFSLTLNSTHANQNLYAVTYVTYEIDDVSYVSISDMDSSIVK